MSCDYNYIFKVIVAGSPGVGKTCFLNQNNREDPHYYNSTINIGVSFQIFKCELDENTSIKLQLWDIKASSRFIDLYQHFYKGASGCILCFDVSNRDSFDHLPNWIKIIRLCRGNNIPIVLIGTKSDLDQHVSEEEINNLIGKYELDGVFFTTTLNFANRDIIFKHLARKLIGDYQTPSDYLNSTMQKQLKLTYVEKREKFLRYCQRFQNLASFGLIATPPEQEQPTLNDTEIVNELERLRELIGIGQVEGTDEERKLSEEERVVFNQFINFFSHCPICKKKNHRSALKKFYFDTDPHKVEFKDRLLELMEESHDFDNIFFNQILLGIPCCTCYEELF